MTHSAMPAIPRYIIAASITLGIILMFGAALKERIVNPSLIQQNEPNAASEGNQMSPLIGQLMQEIQQNPNDASKMLHLAHVLIEEEQWDAAENFIHRVLEMAPNTAQAHYLHGIVLNKAERNAEAAESLEQVLALEERASARYSLAILYIHYLNKKDKGIMHLQKGIEHPDTTAELKAAMQEELKNAQAQ